MFVLLILLCLWNKDQQTTLHFTEKVQVYVIATQQMRQLIVWIVPESCLSQIITYYQGYVINIAEVVFLIIICRCTLMGINFWYSGVYHMKQRDHAVFLKSAQKLQTV